MMQEMSIIDDLPATNIELEPEKIEDGKDGGPSFYCDLYDTELVHKVAQVFTPGLATACVDNTSGDIFRTPASVAADVRKELVEYVTQRSENFVAESVILEGGQDGQVSDHPYDIISDFVDDFASSKRNLFSRVSGWLLSEKREDKIDDFVQEMEINRFWLVDKRETVAQTLVKNVDLKNEHHCDMKFHTPEELAAHVSSCNFRSMSCTNEGCNTLFCASYSEKHDALCPFKIIPCEQNCSISIMRREMDRHCISNCPMKLVSCPFYAVGCQSPIPVCNLEQHRLDDLDSHVLFILQCLHKEASTEDLKGKLEQLRQAASVNELAQARDVRSLTSAVKGLEAKLGPMEVSRKHPEYLKAEDRPEEIRSDTPKDEEVEIGLAEVSKVHKEDVDAKLVPKEVSKHSDILEDKQGSEEVSNKTQGDMEVKTGPEDVRSKHQEDFEAKLVPTEGSIETKPEQKEVSKFVEDVETKTVPKEINCRPAEDLEAKTHLKELSEPSEHPEAKSVSKELCNKPAEHLEAKPLLKEIDCSESPEYEELSSKEASSELKATLEKKKASCDSQQKPDTKLGNEWRTKSPHQEFETEVGRNEAGIKPLEEPETELETKQMSSKIKEELETELATKEVSSKIPLELEIKSEVDNNLLVEPSRDKKSKAPESPEALSRKDNKSEEMRETSISAGSL